MTLWSRGPYRIIVVVPRQPFLYSALLVERYVSLEKEGIKLKHTYLCEHPIAIPSPAVAGYCIAILCHRPSPLGAAATLDPGA